MKSQLKPPRTAPAERDRVTPESLGRELRQALPPLRVHSASIHDHEGDALWLSEGALGPDEHFAVLGAMGSLGLDSSTGYVDQDLGEGRSAAFFPVRSPYGELFGLVMVIADSKAIDRNQGARFGTPEVRAILQRLAIVLRPASASAPAVSIAAPAVAVPAPVAPVVGLAADTHHMGIVEFSIDPTIAHLRATVTEVVKTAEPAYEPTMQIDRAGEIARMHADEATVLIPPARLRATMAKLSARAAVAAAASAPASAQAAAATPEPAAALATPEPAAAAVPAPAAAPLQAQAPVPELVADDEFMLTPQPVTRTETESDATLYVPQAAIRDVVLHAQQLLKLRSGGRTRRYEVLLRSRSEPDSDEMPASAAELLASQGKTSTMDRYITGELITWLSRHRETWEAEPASFSINLAPSTLADDQFLSFVAAGLREARLSAESIGFEIPERAIIENREAVDAFVRRCEILGCFVVLDDFSLHHASLPLLASSAVKLVKVDAKLTSAALKDKLSQAIVIAISQAAKVLGVHCVAKRVDTPVARQWLSAIGIDFAQGFLLERPVPLESLATVSETAKPRTGARSSRAASVSKVAR